MKRRHLAVVLVAMVALSGCAVLDSETDDGSTGDSETDAADAEFSHDVNFAWAGVAGDSLAVEVTVENTGSDEATDELTVQANGEAVASESVTVGGGATKTVTLTHTFEEAGEHELAVGDEQTTLTVYESASALFGEAEFNQGTRVSEEETNASGTAIQDGTEFNVQIDESATIRTNYDEETQYTITETTTEVFGRSTEETTEEWVVDGTEYAKIQDHSEGTVNYEQEPSDEFEDDTDFSGEVVREYLTVEQTDGEYVFTVDPDASAEAGELWAAISDDEEIPSGSITELTLEYRLDAQRYRPTGLTADIRIERYDIFETLEMTITEEIVSYGDPVEVEVPEDVRENT